MYFHCVFHCVVEIYCYRQHFRLPEITTEKGNFSMTEKKCTMSVRLLFW